MITITNNKVAGFQPTWASFRGFSFLFDNPGDSLALTEEVEKIDCKSDSDVRLLFYQRLQEALSRIGGDLLTNAYLFCPLPPSSYHVTVCDGINMDNLAAVLTEHHHEIAAFINGLPSTLVRIPESMKFLTDSNLATKSIGKITFKFRKLTIWGNKVMVARLEAANEEAARCLTDLVTARSELCQDMYKFLSVKVSHHYSPHVSLGYFANIEHGELATARLEVWTEVFTKTLAEADISYDSISFYGFTDMASFFRKPRERKGEANDNIVV